MSTPPIFTRRTDGDNEYPFVANYLGTTVEIQENLRKVRISNAAGECAIMEHAVPFWQRTFSTENYPSKDWSLDQHRLLVDAIDRLCNTEADRQQREVHDRAEIAARLEAEFSGIVQPDGSLIYSSGLIYWQPGNDFVRLDNLDMELSVLRDILAYIDTF